MCVPTLHFAWASPDDLRTCLGFLAGGSDVFEVGGYEWKLEMYPYSQVAVGNGARWGVVATVLLACRRRPAATTPTARHFRPRNGLGVKACWPLARRAP